MRQRSLSIVGGLVAGIAAAFLATLPVAGQVRRGTQQAAIPSSNLQSISNLSRGIRRLPDGHPDLQGTYDVATLTPLERPAGLPLVLADEEAAKLEGQVAERKFRAGLPSRGDRAAPPVGGDGSAGPAGNVGGYNNFWIDNGTRYVTVDGRKRSSILVDPPDGRIPEMTPEAQQRAVARAARTTSDQQAREDDPGFEAAPRAYDDPERRPLGERCLLGFGSTSGPPSLPVLYNNLHQIVQTPDSVIILNEMVHDARIVRMNAPHLPPAMRRWMGDSVGRWEGDTLVVDTTNFTDKTRFRGSSENLHVVERFTRIDANTLRYRFTIEDPTTWTKPWTGEYPWPATDEHVYEYACHEANYALGDILRGARLKEADEAAKRSKQR
jgi:hypothetical protein